MRRFIVFLLFSLFGTALFSQSIQYLQVGTKEGLSYSYVTALRQDGYGRLWIGTSNGVNILSNGQISAYTEISNETMPLPIGRVVDIVCSSEVLVATSSTLLRFDEGAAQFEPVEWEGEEISASAMLDLGRSVLVFESNLKSLLEYSYETREVKLLADFSQYSFSSVRRLIRPLDSTDDILIADNSHGVYEYSLSDSRLSHIDSIPESIYSAATYLDSHNNLWISPSDGGVCCYAITEGFPLLESFSRADGTLSNDAVLSIIDRNGAIYISTDGGGLNRINLGERTFDVLENPLVQSVTVLGKLDTGDMVAGTTHYGVVSMRENFIKTLHSNNQMFPESSLSNVEILSILEDPDYGIWLGTDGGGLDLYDEENGEVRRIRQTKNLKINSICCYGKNTLLLKVYNEGLYVFDKETYELSAFRPRGIQPVGLSGSLSNGIRLLQNDNGDIFIFNCADSHYLHKVKDGSFVSFASSLNNDGTSEPFISIKQSGGYIYAASRQALFEINDVTLSVRELYRNSQTMKSVYFDDDDNAWFIDADGIGYVQMSSGTLARIPQVGDVSSYSTIAVDANGNVWVTMTGGMLMSYNTFGRTFSFFSQADGVEETYFSWRFTHTSAAGNVYLPGNSGLMVVCPEKARVRQEIDSDPALLSISVDGQPVDFGKNPIRIPNRYNAIKVVTSNYSKDPFIQHRLRFILSGRGGERTTDSKEDDFIIHQRPAGRYNVSVSSFGHTGWSEPVSLFSFRVLHPLWTRFYMLLLYFSLLVLFIFVRESQRHKQEVMKEEKRQHEFERKQVEDKVVFMTNIAHELRTPLSLVYNPVKRMLEDDAVPENSKSALNQVSHQISRMTQMINMVLDVQKMDITNSSILVEPVGLNRWIRKIGEEFRMECEEKGLSLEYALDDSIGDVNLDRSKIEVAFSNLVMNAIKYSDSGTITVSTGMADKDFVRISVSDEGRGFTGDPEVLFQRYFQSDPKSIGYGIGLSYTKMLIDKHNGRIGAFNNKISGATFYFDIPTNLEYEGDLLEYRLYPSDDDRNAYKDLLDEDSDFRTDTQTLLIVDNQSNILRYVKSEYQGLFKHIYTAENGQEALDIIKYKLPSIVVSDVMMPVMNGFELCKAIKSDISISNIPVILLTARDDPENQEMGYKLGADCFVPKPFDIKMLYYIIKNQLKNRFEVKKQYASVAFQNSSEDLTFSIVDEKFILKLNKFILDNISDPELDIDKIVDHMCMSRTNLFYKMNDLTGMSASKYIRKIRLDKAKEYLKNTDMSISDISFKLGFAESRYFSTVFKQETGETPSQYKKHVRSEDPDVNNK